MDTQLVVKTKWHQEDMVKDDKKQENANQNEDACPISAGGE